MGGHREAPTRGGDQAATVVLRLVGHIGIALSGRVPRSLGHRPHCSVGWSSRLAPGGAALAGTGSKEQRITGPGTSLELEARQWQSSDRKRVSSPRGAPARGPPRRAKRGSCGGPPAGRRAAPKTAGLTGGESTVNAAAATREGTAEERTPGGSSAYAKRVRGGTPRVAAERGSCEHRSARRDPLRAGPSRKAWQPSGARASITPRAGIRCRAWQLCGARASTTPRAGIRCRASARVRRRSCRWGCRRRWGRRSLRQSCSSRSGRRSR